MSKVYDCAMLTLPRFENPAGNLTPLYGGEHVPFEIARVFYLYDIPGGTERGAHAHIVCHQLMVAASGSFDVLLDDGRTKRAVALNRPYHALHIVPGIWAHEFNFSSGGICMVFASHLYEPDDYIRDYQAFLDYKGIE